MDDPIPDLNLKNCVKTYANRKVQKLNNNSEQKYAKADPLTTKNAIKFLLEGNLRTKICRYCLNVTPELSELDQILYVGGKAAVYKVTIKDMVASFHPFKVADDPNFPNKICNKCLDRTISAYLFAQQCEQAERALRNCFEDIYDKFEKLDPLERLKKRGRHKLHPNHNKLYTEHLNVIDYAEPLINIINIGSESLIEKEAHTEDQLTELECKKCWKVLPNVESLVNHEKSHPKTMWYNCRLCGQSFAKRHHLKKHQRTHSVPEPPEEEQRFNCNECNAKFDNYNEYLQHKENHKFKFVMEHLIERKMNVLCSICLDKGTSLTDLDSQICIHGPYPELSGNVNLYNVLASTLPDMNILNNYSGRKICKTCLDHAITSYIFIHRACFVKNRLNTCITLMLDNLDTIEPDNNIFIEINQNVVCPKLNDSHKNLDKDDMDGEYTIDVLEDEFRDESESDDNISKKDYDLKVDDGTTDDVIKALQKTIKDSINDYSEDNNSNIKDITPNYNFPLTDTAINGYRDKLISDICSEFLTFNKKKTPKASLKRSNLTCPLCNKHFISIYFLKRHILKHVNKKVICTTCKRKFASKFHLHEHVKMAHLLETFYVACTTCGRTFTSQSKLIKHENHHKTKTCILCDKQFLTQKHYDTHMQRHALIFRSQSHTNDHTCSFCEKICPTDNELSLHVNKVHLQIKPYACDMCDRAYYTEYDLRNHKMVHSIPKKEKCEFCSKILKCRKQLVIHVRKHIGAKPFGCLICSEEFYSQYKREEHMQLSHGGKYCCRICHYVLTTRTALKDHTQIFHGYM